MLHIKMIHINMIQIRRCILSVMGTYDNCGDKSHYKDKHIISHTISIMIMIIMIRIITVIIIICMYDQNLQNYELYY